MKQLTASRPLKVTLISAPKHPIGTLWYVWEQSRSNDPLPFPEEVEAILEREPMSAFAEKVNRTVEAILNEAIPVTENLQFVFHIENMSISLREQMVRHRIGTTVGDRLGADIVPDLSQSTWWSQTMRVLPMDNFFDEGRYLVPEGLDGKVTEDGVDAKALYLTELRSIQESYRRLVAAGVAKEDARQLIPIGATHGITWGMNLKAILHIFGKRACWVAQANLWETLMAQAVNELATKVHPMFRKIVMPPCIRNGKYTKCPVPETNYERIQGRDHMPPCPTYVRNQPGDALEAYQSVCGKGETPAWYPPVSGIEDVRNWGTTEGRELERTMLFENAERFKRLWKLDLFKEIPTLS